MHMEARRLYRIKKARKEVAELPEEKTMIEKDLGLRHQQWLEALDKLEAKPLEEAPEPERVDPLVRCYCWEGSRYCNAIQGEDTWMKETFSCGYAKQLS